VIYQGSEEEVGMYRQRGQIDERQTKKEEKPAVLVELVFG
jgi:hypothetical protein